MDTIKELSLNEAILDYTKIFFMSTKYKNKISVQKIISLDYDKSGSLYSETMSPGYGKSCLTCLKTIKQGCPGHFGVIDLEEPIIHPMISHAVIYVLQCICHDCGHLLITDSVCKEQKFSLLKGINRLKAMADFIKTQKNITCIRKMNPDEMFCQCGKSVSEIMESKDLCDNCDYQLQLFNSNNRCRYVKKIFKTSTAKNNWRVPYNIIDSVSDSKNQKTFFFKNKDIIKIFKRIPNSDIKLMGFDSKDSHPVNLIMENLLVIPPSVRPKAVRDGNVSHNHITICYQEILKQNLKLKALREKGISVDNNDGNALDCMKIMYETICAMFDNVVSKHKVGIVVIVSLRELICGKGGHQRGSGMAKRSTFSARGVADSAYYLPIDTISVPEKLKRTLSKQIVVNKYNKQALMEMYYNTDKVITIARSNDIITSGITNRNMLRFNADAKNKEWILNIGDVLEIEAEEDDYVILNRQPTLHKGGFMGHRITFNNSNSIKIPSGVTTSYNADFDGDELNLHCCQGIESRVEVEEIMNINNNFINAPKGVPNFSLLYNDTSAFFFATKYPFILTEKEWIEGTSRNINKKYLKTLDNRCLKHNVNPRSTIALISSCFPSDFYYCKYNDKNEVDVLIKDGILIKGVLKKSHIGSTPCSIVQTIWNDYGKNVASRFVTEGQFIGDWFITIYGVSIGLEDCMPINLVDVSIDVWNDLVPRELDNKFKHHTVYNVFNSLLAEDFNYIDEKNEIEIKNGKVINGNIKCKDFKKFIKEDARSQKIFKWYKELSGSENGEIYFNLVPPVQAVDEFRRNAEIRIASLNIDKNEKDTEVFEYNKRCLSLIMNEFNSRCASLIKDNRYMKENNPIKSMLNAGSKGSATNTQQILINLGQTFHKSDLPPRNFDYYGRNTPYFDPEDDSLQARGCIFENFTNGLSAASFYEHLSASRLGSIDTNILTAEIGHAHRQLRKTLEDLKINYDGSVGTLRGLYQNSWGDGLNSESTFLIPGKNVKQDLSFVDYRKEVEKLQQ